MKEFITRFGGKRKTMTISDLKKKLDEFPDDLPVFATWEGVYAYIEPENFSVEKLSKCRNEECNCLVIDVEQY